MAGLEKPCGLRLDLHSMGCFKVLRRNNTQEHQLVQHRSSDPAPAAAGAGFKGIPVPLPPPFGSIGHADDGGGKALPLPRPMPAAIPLPRPLLRSFDFEALRASLLMEPPIRKGYVHRASVGSMQVDVIRLHKLRGSVEDWVSRLKLLAQLEYHDNVSSLVGFAIGGTSEVERMLVFESAGSNVSLDRALHSLDWDARVRVALAVARGLAHLHNKLPLPGYGTSFGSSNVVLDCDRDRIKLVDYGLQLEEHDQQQRQHSSRSHVARIAPESMPASVAEVRGYGIVLLELLTGKKQQNQSVDERWGRSFVNDRSKLSSIMDTRLLSWNLKAATVVANLALNCLLSPPCTTMAQAVATLEPLLVVELVAAARSRKATAAAAAARAGAFRRSATFSCDKKTSSSLPSPGFRSAGASPAHETCDEMDAQHTFALLRRRRKDTFP